MTFFDNIEPLLIDKKISIVGVPYQENVLLYDSTSSCQMIG